MQPNLFPFGTLSGNPFLLNEDLREGGGFQSWSVFFFLLFRGGGTDLSKVGEKILSLYVLLDPWHYCLPLLVAPR